jgi:hypothetical protein
MQLKLDVILVLLVHSHLVMEDVKIVQLVKFHQLLVHTSVIFVLVVQKLMLLELLVFNVIHHFIQLLDQHVNYVLKMNLILRLVLVDVILAELDQKLIY